jgi:hypothetical protein
VLGAQAPSCALGLALLSACGGTMPVRPPLQPALLWPAVRVGDAAEQVVPLGGASGPLRLDAAEADPSFRSRLTCDGGPCTGSGPWQVDLHVTFSPDSEGERAGTLQVTGKERLLAVVLLQGHGYAPALACDDSLDFGAWPATRELRCSNATPLPTPVRGRVEGSAAFTLEGGLPAMVEAQPLVFTVGFRPPPGGEQRAEVVLSADTGEEVARIALRGGAT